MTLYTEASGSGSELVLIHGWGLHSGIWRRILPGLSNEYRVTLVDLPGHGRSPAIPGLELDDLVAIILESVPDCASWIGWSLGGLVAVRAAVMAPGCCTQLVTVACNPRFVRGEGWDCAMPEVVLSSFADALQEDYRATLNRFLALQVRGSDQSSGVLRQLRRDLAAFTPDPTALRDGLEILAGTDLVGQLPGIDCPCLFLMGERDTLVPPDAAYAAAGRIPEAVVRVIRGAGHAPFLSHPGEFISALRSFLELREVVRSRHG